MIGARFPFDPARFYRKVQRLVSGPIVNGERCHIWVGARSAGKRSLVYGRIQVTEAGRPRRWVSAHRAAMWLKLGRELEPRETVLHLCDVSLCVNTAHHLLGSIADNNADARAKGRAVFPLGQRNGNASLTERDVVEIRASPWGHTRLARHFGVTEGCVRDIRKRKTWRHVS